MSRTSDVNKLITQARESGLVVDVHANQWRVTNPDTGERTSIPSQGMGRSLKNYRAQIRRLGVPKTASEEEAVGYGWSIAELLDMAERTGVTACVRGGLLEVSAPPGVEHLARLLRDREQEVLAHLTPEETAVPTVGQIARVTVSDREADLPHDTYALWEVVRALAKDAGDVAASGKASHVIWRGQLAKVIADYSSEWDASYRGMVTESLGRSGHLRCQSPNAQPPTWQVARQWSDVAEPPVLSDEELLAAITARLKSSPTADAEIAELTTANEALRSRITDLTTQLAERDARLEMFEQAAAIFRGA